MFVFDLRLSRTKKIIIISALLLTAALISLPIFVCASKVPVRDTATCDEVGEYELFARTPAEQREFLSRFGLCAGEPKRDEVTIPPEFSAVYEEYNELQKQIGLDLTPYKGERVQRLTFELAGSDSPDPLYAVLLVRKGRVIGGHLTDGVYQSPCRALSTD